MPRISKTSMQLYREKLAKALEERMPFMDSPNARKLFGKKYWNEIIPEYDYYGYDPYATERDDGFMVGFPRGSRNIHINDLAPEDMWELYPEPEMRTADYVPVRVPKDNVDSLASAIYNLGERFYPKSLERAREVWNKEIEPDPYPQRAWPRERPNPTEDEFMRWRLQYISPDDRDYFRRRAQRDWNDWVKREALKQKFHRF